MDIRLSVVRPRGADAPVDLALRTPPGATAQDLRRVLAGAVGHPDPAAPLFAGGEEIPAGAIVGQPPLLEGTVISVGAPGMSPQRRVPGVLELHSVGGPDAGQVFRLTPGSHRVGRAAEATLRLADPDISRVHAEVTVAPEGVFVTDLGSTNGTWLDGERLGPDRAPLTTASRLVVGSTTLALRVPDGTAAATHPDGLGHVGVNRSPRILPPVEPVEVRLPPAPERPEGIRFPVVAMVLPVLLAGVMSVVLRSSTMLLFGLMSPAMMLGNYVSDRRGGRRSHAERLAGYDRASTRARARIDAALAEEAARRRAQAPDPAELLITASAPLSRIWERRRRDDDVLRLRLGTRDLPSQVTITDPDAEGSRATPDVPDVPVSVPLAELGVLGVAGRRDQVTGLVRSLLAQVCGWHSPRDVDLVVLAADPGLAQDWAWTAYLPHTRPADEEECRNRVGVLGGTSDQVQRRVAELGAVVEARAEALRRSPSSAGWAGPRTVVLLDGAQRLRAVPGVPQLLEDGPEVGVCFICVDENAARLPVEAHGTVHVEGEVTTTLRVALSGRAPLPDVVADLVSARWAERFARALAPLRDATPDDDSGQVPESARLLDVLDLDATDPAEVAARWQASPRSTLALLGVAAAGPYVDLRRDGPHGLVGGTTGSGKSELLQTVIASLALGNRPDEMSFVLVDYKGGSAFKDCARLPHTVGLVTDLDGHLTERALVSLEAELKRREQQLRRLGAKDIEDYHAAAGPADPAMPRLVLVIDEFRMLAEELPGFVDGLVRIAAVGRSLGVHLLLATQRPGGIVSADIKANVNLRIALRVRDRSDSEDVVDSPDAAAISERTPGRAYGRSGANPLVMFQSARVGGHGAEAVAPEVVCHRLSWATLGDPPPRVAARADQAGPTDLARIVEATTTAASVLGIAPARSPWLPPLADVVTLDELDRDAARAELAELAELAEWAVPYALLDLPEEQDQRPLAWDLEHDGHLAIAGTSRSGRTTLLRTIAGSLGRRFSPADVHLLALDGSSGALGPLLHLPHTGAVVTRDQVARGDRLITRLLAEITQRQNRLGRGGFTSVAEQRRHAAATGEEPIPWVVLLVDGWEGIVQAFEAVDHGRPVEDLLRVLREGAAAGVRVVVAGDRSVLLSKVASLVADKVVLRMADPTDLVMAGVPARAVPVHLPPGRGIRTADATELQVAVLSDDLAGPAQVAALAALGDAARTRWPDVPRDGRPMRVEQLPTRVAATTLAADADDVATGPGWALVGVGGDDLAPVGLDLAEEARGVLVAGPPGSGRSTTLATMALHLAGRGRPVAVVTARRSPLVELAGHPGVVGVCSAADAETLIGWRREEPALVVFADDAELMLDSPCEPVLAEILRTAEDSGGAVVCSGASAELSGMFRGITVEVRKHRTGVLLNPAGFSDGDLLGVRLSRGDEPCPGRGVLVRRGSVLPVQVATPD